jgi:Na+/H+-dicarboxylate symporter/ABC-type amino acid transport substrate-binding protein
MSLSTQILAGAVLGVGCGLFLGEHAAVFTIVGDAFVGLLQMTVLPYIILALVGNLGRLTPQDGRRFGAYAGGFLLLSLVLTLGAVLLLPLSLPSRESASFFSTGSLQEPAEVDFLGLFIPSNPFHALANSVVPAVVVFCIAVGLAIMTLKDKTAVLGPLDSLGQALARINGSLVRLTPIGVFAIIASMSGTMQVEELARLKAYLVLFAVATGLIGYGILMPLLATLTPFTYRQLFDASRTPVLTAFATGKVFIVLPMIVAAAEELFANDDASDEPTAYVGAVTPLVYPFPHAGKLLALLFVPFSAWFVDQPIRLGDYPLFLASGLFSMFGSPMAAIPFLLDQLRLPADMFQLFVVSGVLASRLGDLLGVIHLLFVSVLTSCALTGRLRVDPRRLLPVCVVVVVGAGLLTGATRTYLDRSLGREYDKDDIVRGMHSALHSSVSSVVHRQLPDGPPPSRTTLERIAESGVLRVGYQADNLPSSFFNADGELVGYDIDMAHLLAAHLQCRIEFVPFEFAALPAQLERGDFDIAMSGVTMLPHRMARMRFTEPYTEITAALLVPDHRREEFELRMEQRRFSDLRIGIARTGDAAPIVRSLMPGVETVTVASLQSFLESGGIQADAAVWTAEGGAAWSLLYPQFSVVLIRPVFQAPVGYPVARGNEAFAQLVSSWIQFATAGGYTQRLYDHWILGRDAVQRAPRWSVVRDVLGWVE